MKTQRGRKLLSLLLTLALLLGMLPAMSTTALAAETVTKFLRDNTAAGTVNGTGWTWYHDESYNGKLTLNGYNGGPICVTGTQAGNVEIELVGNNTITATEPYDGSGNQCFGIYLYDAKDVTFTGSGSLTVNVNAGSSILFAKGIYMQKYTATSGSLAVKDTAKLTINMTGAGMLANGWVCGIDTADYTSSGNITVESNAGLAVNLTCDNDGNDGTLVYGLYTYNGVLTINGALNIKGTYTGSGTLYPNKWKAVGRNTGNMTTSTIGSFAAIDIDMPNGASHGGFDDCLLEANGGNALGDPGGDTGWESTGTDTKTYTAKTFRVTIGDKSGLNYADYSYAKKSTYDGSGVSINNGINDIYFTAPYYKNDATSTTADSSDWNAHYDDTTGVLELNGYNGGGIYSTQDLVIKLTGTNTITNDNAVGINIGNGGVTFTGSGSLTINNNGSHTAIWANSGKVTVESGTLTVNETAPAGTDCMGIQASAGVALRGGELTIDLTTAAGNNYGYGVYTRYGEVTVASGAVLDITLNNKGTATAYGIYNEANTAAVSNGDINLAGTVTIRNGESTGKYLTGIYSYGASANTDGVFSVTGGSVTLTGLQYGMVNYAKASAGAGIRLTGGTVAITGTVGLHLGYSGLAVTGGKLTVNTTSICISVDSENESGLVTISGSPEIRLTSGSYAFNGTDMKNTATRIHSIDFTPGGSLTVDCSAGKQEVPLQGYFRLGENTQVINGFKSPYESSKASDGTPMLYTNSTYNYILEIAYGVPGVSTCTVSFDPNGGSGTMADVTVTAGASYTLPECGFNAPSGMKFKGWSVGGTEYAVGSTITVSADTTVTAVWEDISVTTYTVTVTTDGHGSAAATPASAAAGTVITLSATPSSGYHFKEWEVVSGSVSISSDNKFTMPAGDVEVKAIFEEDAPATYTVTFFANGGTGSMTTATVTAGASYTLPECGFNAPSGQQFKAWSVGGNEYAVGDAITVNANTTVTAVWEDIPLTPVAVPSAETGLVYNGTVQTGVKAAGAGYTLSGNTATDAGVYTAIATLNTGYKWSDNSTGAKTISWSIAKKTPAAADFTVTIPAGGVYDGNARTAAATLKSGYTGAGTITVKYNGAATAPVNAGTYTVTIDVAEGDNFNAGTLSDDSWTFTIAKATWGTPSETLTPVSPTTAGGSDGKITGVTTAMEYRKSGDSEWTACTGAEITGLTAGTYQLRYAADQNHMASDTAYQTVTVTDPDVVRYSVTVIGGTASPSGDQPAAAEITITADAKPGYKFKEWTGLADASYKLGSGKTSNPATFVMPAFGVVVTATYEPAALTGTVSITGTSKYGGTLTASVSGSNNTGVLSYQWNRGGAAIDGATGSSYVLTEADIGKSITVTVRSSVQTGTLSSGAVTIAKADGPAVPTGLNGVACTTSDNNDGKITGVTTAMEYSADSGKTWQDCPDGAITGLTNGAYQVRYKATTTHEAGTAAGVTVPAYQHTHSFENIVKPEALKTPADCTHDAVYYKSCACGALSDETFTDVGSALDHSWGKTWSSDDDGHWHECTRCGVAGDKEDHTPSGWIVDADATATTDGSQHKECTACGRLLETGIIPATGYLVTFNANGGTASADSARTDKNGRLATLPVATRSGSWSFAGWYTAAHGGTEITTSYQFTADTIVYAQWKYIDSGVSTYAITVESAQNGGVTSSHRNAARGTTITLTVEPDKGYTLETLTVTDRSGNELELTSKGGGRYTFQMPASNVTVTATFMEDNSMLNFFVDVFPGNYYYDAVLWAAENGITGGTDDTHFSPYASCTRAQAVTFLWRAAGCPAPESSVMPFTDVKAGSYYYNAVLWAVENGITEGTSDTTFSPNATCTRAQIVTFIYRSEQAKGNGMQGAWMFLNPFTDVDLEKYYGEAVMWAVASGVTTGTGDGTTFSPNTDCTRAQIVTFIWRALAE